MWGNILTHIGMHHTYSRWITGIAYGLKCFGTAPGTKSMWNFL
jgi:hypothetical protein